MAIATIVDLLRLRAEREDAKACIRTCGPEPGTGEKELGAREFHRLLTRKSRLFSREHGLRPGDTIALMADNSLEYLILVYAALFAGLSVLVISTRSLPEHLLYFLRRSDARHLFCSAAWRAGCEKAARELGADAARFVSGMEPFAPDDDGSAADAGFEPPAVKDSDTAIILHTSGTTRTPKLVYLSHRNIVSNQLASDVAFGKHWTAGDSSLSWLPLYHGYALLAEFLRDMLSGATFVLYRPDGQGQMRAEVLVKAIRDSGINILCCVPWMLGLLHDRIREEETSGSSATLDELRRLKFIVTGGSPLGASLGDFFRERGVRIVTMFGLSEAAGFVLHSPFDGSRWDLLLPNAPEGVAFVPIDGQKREHELVITNPALFTRKVLRAEGEQDGDDSSAHLATGDLFVFRDEGWLYVGRGDQIYNGAHGEKVNPLLFESALEQSPEVKRAFVFGEELSFNVALVELVEGTVEREQVIEALRRQVREKLNPSLESPDRVYPNDLFFLDEGEKMPLTPKGTVNRREAALLLKARLARREQVPASPALDAESLDRIFHEELAAYRHGADDGDLPGRTLLELGFDSLMTLSFRNNLQEKLGLRIPVELLLSYPPLGELLQALQALNAEAQGGAAPGEELQQEDAQGWRRIGIEQVIFHRAYYLFPGPTFGGSFSLVAPRRLEPAEIEGGLRFLERNHEVLRSIYRPDGRYRIADYSMLSRAFISHTLLEGSHDLNANPRAQELIRQLALEHFNFDEGPAWRYATADIRNEHGELRTMLFIGVNHIIGDFRSFSLMVREFMLHLDGKLGEADVVPDRYRAAMLSAHPDDIRRHQATMETLLTSGLEQLPRGVDLRAGARVRFNFRDIRLPAVGAILRQHNISLFNAVYVLWIVTASRFVEGMRMEDFPSTTSVTTRISKELESVMGCFVHTPIYRFHLDPADDMKTCARKVQAVTLDAFKGVLVDPVEYFAAAVARPANLMPIIKRNVFLYRSPDEIIEEVPLWGCYRNDYFEDRCNVGAYFDFCANPLDGSMEGYLTVNLQFCSRETAERIVGEVEKLMRAILDNPGLDFIPAAL